MTARGYVLRDGANDAWRLSFKTLSRYSMQRKAGQIWTYLKNPRLYFFIEMRLLNM